MKGNLSDAGRTLLGSIHGVRDIHAKLARTWRESARAALTASASSDRRLVASAASLSTACSAVLRSAACSALPAAAAAARSSCAPACPQLSAHCLQTLGTLNPNPDSEARHVHAHDEVLHKH